MFRSLLGNALVSAVAFVIVGLIGLLLVPVLVSAYGVAGLGLIMLARLFLPGMGIGVFDFGISEIATQAIAMGRVDQDWDRVHRQLGRLAQMTLALAVLLAVPLAVLAPELTSLFGVSGKEGVDFIEALRCTAALLPLLFLSLMAEGCLKGLDGFRAHRLAEVISAIAYALGAATLACGGAGYKWVAYAYLASLVLRTAFLTGFLARATSDRAIQLARRAEPVEIAYLHKRARVFFISRFLGTVLHQSPTILIGMLVGPAGVGLYDTLARLPRFAKSVLGVLNTTLLPYTTRLDAAGDTTRMNVLLRFGLTILPTLVFPPVATAAALSRPLLSLWIGPEFAVHDKWLALFWALPALNAVVSFQNYVLMSRTSYQQANNRLTLAQIFIQQAISLALLQSLSQFAFIAGYVGSTILLFLWQLSLMHREVDLPGSNIGRLAAYGVVLAGVVTAFQLTAGVAAPATWPALASVGLVLWAMLMALTYALFLDRKDRATLGAIGVMLHQQWQSTTHRAKD